MLANKHNNYRHVPHWNDFLKIERRNFFIFEIKKFEYCLLKVILKCPSHSDFKAQQKSHERNSFCIINFQYYQKFIPNRIFNYSKIFAFHCIFRGQIQYFLGTIKKLL